MVVWGDSEGIFRHATTACVDTLITNREAPVPAPLPPPPLPGWEGCVVVGVDGVAEDIAATRMSIDAFPSDTPVVKVVDGIMGTVKKSMEVVCSPAGKRNTGIWVVWGMGMEEGMMPSLRKALSPTPHTYS